jgi:hypothetical protein
VEVLLFESYGTSITSKNLHQYGELALLDRDIVTSVEILSYDTSTKMSDI